MSLMLTSILLLNQLNTRGVAYRFVKPFDKKVNFVDAMLECRDLNGAQLPNGKDHSEILFHQMLKQNASSVWLSIRKKLSGWKWANGRKNVSFLQSDKELGCAIANIKFKLEARECADPHIGFLCELPGNASCPTVTGLCRELEGKQYWFECKARNWFTSRVLCQKHGGDLVVFEKNLKLESVIKLLVRNKKTRGCEAFYVGLYREYWTIPSGEEIYWNQWGDREPSNHDCVQLYLGENGEGLWRAKDCTADMGYVLCGLESENARKLHPTDKETQNCSKALYDCPPCNNNTAIKSSSSIENAFTVREICLILAAVTGFLALFLISGYFLRKKCLKRKGIEKKRKSNEYDLQELALLQEPSSDKERSGVEQAAPTTSTNNEANNETGGNNEVEEDAEKYAGNDAEASSCSSSREAQTLTESKDSTDTGAGVQVRADVHTRYDADIPSSSPTEAQTDTKDSSDSCIQILQPTEVVC